MGGWVGQAEEPSLPSPGDGKLWPDWYTTQLRALIRHMCTCTWLHLCTNVMKKCAHCHVAVRPVQYCARPHVVRSCAPCSAHAHVEWCSAHNVLGVHPVERCTQCSGAPALGGGGGGGNHWAPPTSKRHIPCHIQHTIRHTNHWAPRTRKRHQQEHRLQRPTESSDPTQHAEGRTGDCPGPRKETTTRRNVTLGVAMGWDTGLWMF